MRTRTCQERRDRFEQLFGEHFGAVSGYAFRRADAGEAEDVVADTFLIAWRRLDEIPDEAKPWLLGVARRVLANRRRAAGRRTALAARVALERAAAPERELSPVLRALARLSDGDREVLLLFAWDGLSSDEAAAALGCSRAAVKVRVHRARRRLHSELARFERDGSTRTTARRLEECHDE